MLRNLLVSIVILCLTTFTPAQVAVAVGGGWGGVAVSTGYGGYGGYYGGYYGGVVAPVGGWYGFGYTSSFCASPVPQVLPIAQPVTAYTVAPAYVQPVQQVVVQQAPAVRQTITEVVEKKKKSRKENSSKECTCSCKK